MAPVWHSTRRVSVRKLEKNLCLSLQVLPSDNLKTRQPNNSLPFGPSISHLLSRRPECETADPGIQEDADQIQMFRNSFNSGFVSRKKLLNKHDCDQKTTNKERNKLINGHLYDPTVWDAVQNTDPRNQKLSSELILNKTNIFKQTAVPPTSRQPPHVLDNCYSAVLLQPSRKRKI